MKILDERDFIIRRWSDLYDLDWYILGPVLVLLLYNFLLLTSAVKGYYLPKQIFFLIPAFSIGLVALFSKLGFWEKSAWWFYVANIILLLIVLIKGASAMGAQRWIDIGFIRLQPSEIAKIAIIISLASWLTKDRKSTRLNSSHGTLSRMPSSA